MAWSTGLDSYIHVFYSVVNDLITYNYTLLAPVMQDFINNILDTITYACYNVFKLRLHAKARTLTI